MTITGLLKSIDIPSSATPSSVRTVSIPAGCGIGNPYRDGCALHEALADKPSGRMAPVVGAVRQEVRKRGGRILTSERSLAEWCGTPSGRADIIATGRGQTGIVEIKVVAELPEEPRGRDLVQLGGYVRLAAHWSHQLSRAWALLIYVDLAGGRIRLFEYRGRELTTLVRGAERALAA